ncbi:hypothetical protein L5515_005691 [Caenorhabditis briggsae]|uniref:RNA helicase n=3 Tax=Caenorhabditis briggsae TaxID=6238 RepID=A0AAE9EYL3_CAEBR|nr:hypothetical protein L5515_005691 [Caenorhabditis briggsae]
MSDKAMNTFMVRQNTCESSKRSVCFVSSISSLCHRFTEDVKGLIMSMQYGNSGGGDGYRSNYSEGFNRRDERRDDRDGGGRQDPKNDSGSGYDRGAGGQYQSRGGQGHFQDRGQDHGQSHHQDRGSGYNQNRSQGDNQDRGSGYHQNRSQGDNQDRGSGNYRNRVQGQNQDRGSSQYQDRGQSQHQDYDRQRSNANSSGNYGRQDDRHGRPDDRNGRQDDRHGRPDDRTGRPDDRHGRPDDRHSRPDDRHGRPDDRHGRPDERQQYGGNGSGRGEFGNPQRDGGNRGGYSDNRGDARSSHQGSNQRDERDQYRSSNSNQGGYGGRNGDRYDQQDSRRGPDSHGYNNSRNDYGNSRHNNDRSGYNGGNDFERNRVNRGVGSSNDRNGSGNFDSNNYSPNKRFDNSGGYDDIGGGRGSFRNDNGFGNGERGGSGGRFNNDNGFGNGDRGGRFNNEGNGGRHFDNDGGYTGGGELPKKEVAPRDWMPSSRDIDELMRDTAEKVQECQVSQDQAVEVRNSPTMDRLTSWEDSHFHPKILDNLRAIKYTGVRTIQAAMIPQILAGYDVIGQAETSAGKTAAFGLPIVDYILKMDQNIRDEGFGTSPIALVIAPVRELAQQIVESFRQYACGTDIKIRLAIGQQSRARCLADIREGCDVVVGTSGRLMDLIGKGEVCLDHLKFLVLDEADRLLQDVKQDPCGHLGAIINDHDFMRNADNRQTLMTSATFDNAVEEVANRLMKKVDGQNDLVRIVLASGRLSNRVDLHFHEAGGAAKHDTLKKILLDTNERGEIPKTLIFVQKKASCDFLASKIQMIGQKLEKDFGVQTLHGDRSQDNRDNTISAFKNGSLKILVTTDVLSRGIDVVDLERVVNFDLPDGSVETGVDTFIHRSGRTGRMHKGTCHSFINPGFDNDVRLVPKLIELVKSTGNPDDLAKVPEFMLELAKRGSNMPSGGGFRGGPRRDGGGGGGYGGGYGGASSKSGFGGGSSSSFGGSSAGGGFGAGKAEGGFGAFGGSSSGGFGASSAATGSFGGNVGGGFGAARAAATVEPAREDDASAPEEKETGALGSTTFGSGEVEEKKDNGNEEPNDEDW